MPAGLLRVTEGLLAFAAICENHRAVRRRSLLRHLACWRLSFAVP